MRAHVALEIKIGELIFFGELKELSELGIGENATSVIAVLEVVSTNVSVNFTSHLGASHLSSNRLS
jgi:hypothetical protein